MALKRLVLTAAASALVSGVAIAQDTHSTGTDTQMTTLVPTDVPPIGPDFTAIHEMTVGDIIGKNVYEPDGVTIGDIDYIVDRDGAASAVVGIGGFLGLGEYTVALPLEDFSYDSEQRMVKVNATKDGLKEQPEFDETGVESLPDETLLSALLASSQTTAPAAIPDGNVTDESGVTN